MDHGPQSDRMARTTPNTVPTPGARTPLPTPAGGSADPATAVWQEQLLSQTRENEHLRGLLSTATAELRRYQAKYPAALGPAAAGDADAAEEEPPPWVTSPEVMSPILVALNARIAELAAESRQQQSTLQQQAQAVEMLTGENTQLREVQLAEAAAAAAGEGAAAAGYAGPVGTRQPHLEELAEMNERVEILMAENDVMVEQCKAASDEAGSLAGALADRDAECGKLSAALEQADAAVAAHAAQARGLSGDKAMLEQKFVAHAEALNAKQATLAEIKANQHLLQKQNTKLHGQAEEYKKQNSELRGQLEDEVEHLTLKVVEARSQITQLRGQLAAKNAQLSDAGERLRDSLSELETMRRDNKGMVQVMGGMEKQLSEYAEKEEAVDEASKISKQRVEEALLERDKAVAECVQSRHEYGQLLDLRRKEADERVAQTEGAVGAVRAKMEDQKGERDRVIRELTEQNAGLQAAAERLSANAKALTARLADRDGTLRDERDRVDLACTDLRRRVEQAEAATDASEARRHALEASAEAAAAARKRDADAASADKTGLQEDLHSAKQRAVQAEGMHRAVSEELKAARASCRELEREAGDARTALSARQTELTREKDEELEALKAKLGGDRSLVAKFEGQLREMADSHRATQERLRSERENSNALVKASLLQEQEAAWDLRSRNAELDVQTRQMAVEIDELRGAEAEMRDMIVHYQSGLLEAERKVGDLSGQLSESLASQEGFIKTEARLKAELSKVQRAKALN